MNEGLRVDPLSKPRIVKHGAYHWVVLIPKGFDILGALHLSVHSTHRTKAQALKSLASLNGGN